MAERTVTTSEHLLRQYAVTMQITKQQYHSLRDYIWYDMAERQLRIETQQIGMVIEIINFRNEPTLIFTEEGEPVEIIKLSCIATGYLSSESSKQTLRKIEIDNAQTEWTEEE
jgi:hypothetical protein